jgi:hypothetical protein
MAVYRELEKLRPIVTRVLDKPVSAGGGARRRISKREALLATLLQKALEGNPIAVSIVIDFYYVYSVRADSEPSQMNSYRFLGYKGPDLQHFLKVKPLRLARR